MKRRLLIVLFTAGAVMGFATGFSHLRAHRADHERRIIDMCVDAAQRAQPSTPAQSLPADSPLAIPAH